MITITLPDNSQRQFDEPVTVAQVAQSIGAGLAKAALAGKVNDQLVDTSYLINHDAKLAIITDKAPEGIDVIRHSTAHLLAQAVKQLFPQAQVTIGPVIENGFYYDFAFDRSFTPDDLEKIEAQMQTLVAQDLPVSRQVLSRDAAIDFFRQQGELYKAEIIASIPADEQLSLYTQGDFTDLCRGPHVPSTGKLKAFKLMKVAGAYWRGDSNNAMLQRIYGTAWADEKALKTYLNNLEEAEKRDHRKIGKALDLFHLQEEAPGMVFWHPNGWSIYQTIKKYMQEKLRLHGYQEINTPQLVDRSLWVASGHAEKFDTGMFAMESEARTYLLKPMNCPCHVQIFKNDLRSYRDLPIRYAEFGSCHRNEPSGSLHGIMRVRGFTQDDAHIFCTEEQVQHEAANFIKLLYEVYADFGFSDVIVKLSTRPVKRVGSEELWDRAEQALANALDQQKITWEVQPGEGAFYGPKIEFSLRDCLGRVWQCGTLQYDPFVPARLGAEYVDDTSQRKTPVMLHRAVFGSMERFIGILIEHYAGQFPVWLAPIQAVVMNITEKQQEYAEKVQRTLLEMDFRVTMDLRNEKIGFKIREHILQRVPYLLVVGDREVVDNTVGVRTRDGALGSMSLSELADILRKQIAQYAKVH